MVHYPDWLTEYQQVPNAIAEDRLCDVEMGAIPECDSRRFGVNDEIDSTADSGTDHERDSKEKDFGACEWSESGK